MSDRNRDEDRLDWENREDLVKWQVAQNSPTERDTPKAPKDDDDNE